MEEVSTKSEPDKPAESGEAVAQVAEASIAEPSKANDEEGESVEPKTETELPPKEIAEVLTERVSEPIGEEVKPEIIEETQKVLSLQDLDLKENVISMLNGAGINSIEELCKKKSDELLKISGLGKGTLKQIRKSLGSHGRKLQGRR